MANIDYLERQQILIDFLAIWPIGRVREMSIAEYVGIGDKNTFCQYLETITRPLGSIKGNNSSKFGIFKRTDKTKAIVGTVDNGVYVWKKHYGTTSEIAFENVRKNIIEAIEYAEKSDFGNIDNVDLPDLLKWKIAFLYSDGAFIPIYSHDALMRISTSLGMPDVKKNTKYSEMHKYISNTKPVGMTVYEHMTYLFEWYRLYRSNKNAVKITEYLQHRRPTRKGVEQKNTEEHSRKGAGSTTITRHHNDMQNKLGIYFQKLYPKASVILEENNVDVTVKLPDGLILVEVKTDSRAEYCIRQGLGQLLTYSFNVKESTYKLMICGKNAPTNDELKFIQYICKILNPIEFEYLPMSEL